MIYEDIIRKEDEEIYKYGLEVAFLKIIHIAIISSIGIAFNCGFEIIVFTICYSFLRKYAGGYHASTSGKCFLISIGIVSFIVFTIYRIPSSVMDNIALLSGVIIFMMAPIESENKPLEAQNFIRNKKISYGILLVTISIYTICRFLKKISIFLPISYALFFCAFFLLITKIKRREG